VAGVRYEAGTAGTAGAEQNALSLPASGRSSRPGGLAGQDLREDAHEVPAHDSLNFVWIEARGAELFGDHPDVKLAAIAGHHARPSVDISADAQVSWASQVGNIAGVLGELGHISDAPPFVAIGP